MNDGDSLFMGLLCAGVVCVLVILADGWFVRPQARSGCDERRGALAAENGRLRAGGLEPGDAVAPVPLRGGRFQSHAGGGGRRFGPHLGRGPGGLRAPAQASSPPRQALRQERVREPLAVEYARSFFPVIVLVLVIRSFLFEPFRIPSDSMMPTLFDGDFIFVSKYSYGLRLPVSNTLLVPTGTPQRGDVIVFRLPPNPKINYIKRLVGLPGDRIRVDENNQLYVNGKPMPQERGPVYAGPKQDMLELRGRPHGFRAARRQAPSHHVRPRRRQSRRMGGARRSTISSWATTATTARTAGSRTKSTRRASCRRRIWWVKRCESGLISILVTDLSGDG